MHTVFIQYDYVAYSSKLIATYKMYKATCMHACSYSHRLS